MPACIYKCKKCKFEWEAYRILLDKYKNPIEFEGPGMTVCPKCHNEEIEWLNYKKFKDWYIKNIGDGGCGGEIKQRSK